MADGCFLILCGIPASGKSTLARDFIQKDWKIAGKCVHFVYINYDDFIPESLPEKEPTHSWKDRRRDILTSLEHLLLHMKSVELETNDQMSHLSTFVSSWCSCDVNSFIRCDNILHVVVIDDNMFYRSMRYEYYQLARKIGFSFAQIYLHCSLELALHRNTQRRASVDEDTIIRMFNCIEKPDPEKFSWEKFNVTLDTSSFESENQWPTILQLLENAALVPAPPLKVSDEMQKAKERAITMKSIVHQADQVIRKLISAKLEELKASDSPSDILKQEASSLNQRRKTIMEQIKKDPRQIIRHFYNHNGFNLDCHSQLDNLKKFPVNKTIKIDKTGDQEPPNSKTFSECEKQCARVSLGCSNEREMDETFLEDFWDIISSEEFRDTVERVFEQS